MASPVCEVKDGSGAWVSTTNGADVTPGNVIGVRLADGAGADVWTLTAIGSDDTTDFSAIVPVVDMTTKTSTFTMPADTGRAIILQSKVNNGRDVNGANEALTTTLGIFALAGGLRVLAINERFESDAVYGWIKDLNAVIRAGGGGGESGSDDLYLSVVSTDTLFGTDGVVDLDTEDGVVRTLALSNGGHLWGFSPPESGLDRHLTLINTGEGVVTVHSDSDVDAPTGVDDHLIKLAMTSFTVEEDEIADLVYDHSESAWRLSSRSNVDGETIYDFTGGGTTPTISPSRRILTIEDADSDSTVTVTPAPLLNADSRKYLVRNKITNMTMTFTTGSGTTLLVAEDSRAEIEVTPAGVSGHVVKADGTSGAVVV